MKTITIRIPLSEYDLDDLKQVVYQTGDEENFRWTFPAEDDDIEVDVWFVKEDDEEV